jgi:hypothetical protein
MLVLVVMMLTPPTPLSPVPDNVSEGGFTLPDRVFSISRVELLLLVLVLVVIMLTPPTPLSLLI